jgi:hypothetical protein
MMGSVGMEKMDSRSIASWEVGRAPMISVDDAKSQLDRGTLAPLSVSTAVKSAYENTAKACLLEHKIKVYYEPFVLPLDVYLGATETYAPDFVAADLKVNGRRVIFETHPMVMHGMMRLGSTISRFGTFESMYGKDFYLVMVSDLSEYTMNFRMGGKRLPKFCDEYWLVQYTRTEHGHPQKGAFDTYLDGFLRRV